MTTGTGTQALMDRLDRWPENKPITTGRAARLMGVSQDTISRWMDASYRGVRLGGWRVGRDRRTTPKHLKEFAERVASLPDPL